MNRRPPAILLSLAVLPLFFSNCLIATQSFNHGKLLNPGEQMVTAAFGWKNSTHYFKQYEYNYNPETNNDSIVYIPDSTRYNWLEMIFDYRAGVLRKYPFGRGLEIGFHIETAARLFYDDVINYSYDSYYGRLIPDTTRILQFEILSQPLFEIECRFGLPDYTLARSIFHHNIATGWITGEFADNGWFIGYAAGWEFRSIMPFVSARLLLTASDKLQDPNFEPDSFFLTHDRNFVSRISTGASIRLPVNYTVLPDYVTPECSLLFPNYANFQPVGFTVAVGIRWLLGQ